MRSPADWPSLADEVQLADTLFSRRGYGLLASWLEGEAARVNDQDFARLFSDHIDLPGVVADDYLHRSIHTSHGTVLGGIRFKGRDINRPFVEIIVHSFDDLDRLRDCVRQEWSMFAPPLVRIRTRPGRITGPNVVLDTSIYFARYRDMCRPPVHISLEPFEQLEAAAALVRARYQRLAADDPELARNVAPASTEDLRLWHESGQLRAVRNQSLQPSPPGAVARLAAADLPAS